MEEKNYPFAQGMTRRGFLGTLGVTAAGLGLVGCSGGGDDAPAGDDTTETPASEGKVLNTSTIATGTADKGPYPWYNSGGETSNVLTNALFRALLIPDATLQNMKGDLAEDWTVSDDGLTYTFTLKEGVKWSDGEDLTVDDVVFSLNTVLKCAVVNGLYTSTFNGIVGADAVVSGAAESLEGVTADGNTVSITLTAPNSNFLAVMGQFMIMPEHALADVDPLELNTDNFWANPVTCGRFVITEMNAGNYYTLGKNENFEGEQAKIDQIINHLVADYSTAAQSGQVDYISSNNVDVVKAMSGMDNMEMFPVDILFYRYFICNIKGTDGNENPVMADPRVREAILHAIDRETLVTQLLPDMGTVINSGVPNSDPAYDGTTWDYDPELAKKLLDEAGYDYSHTLKILYYNTDQTTIDFLDAVAAQLREIGMTVETYQSQQGTTDMFQTRNYDIGYKGLSAFSMTEYFTEYESTSTTFQAIFGGDTAFDEAITAYKTAADDAAKEAALKDLQAIEAEKLYKLPLFTQGNNVFINKDRVVLPDDLEFGNPFYNFDMQLEKWDINA